MVVFDVIVNGQIQETIQPVNQRLREMYWFMVDQKLILKDKYGNDFKIYKRIVR